MSKRIVNPERVEIAGPAGLLAGIVDLPAGPLRGAALICHPHPLHQGTMRNKVVHTLARSFNDLAMIAVRFNFRGVGGSAGRYAEGVGEREDALAAAAWMRARWPGSPLYLGGFSFGAGVAITVAAELAPRGLVTVAPPVRGLAADRAMPACPWLIVQGEADDVVAPAAVRSWAERLTPPPRLAIMKGAGHFFHGRLTELREIVIRFFQEEELTTGITAGENETGAH